MKHCGALRSPAAVVRALIGACLYLACVQTTQASCKTPLPSNELRELDESVDADPLRAIDAARALVREAEPADNLRNAQLYAIIADAFDTLSNDLEAQKAVAAARKSLAQVRNSPVVPDLHLRLELVEADTAQSEPDLAATVAELNDLEPTLGPGSLGRACLLLVRSRIQGRLNQHELAAKDGMLAHELAVASGSTDAVAEAAYQLGTTFRRAGLYEDALRMEEELITYARAKKQRAALASGLWVKAQVLGAMYKTDQSLPILAEAESLSVELKDDTGIAFINMEKCLQLRQLKRYDEAENACRVAERLFDANGRRDQKAIALVHHSGIDLECDRPREALAKLTQALAGEGHDIPPTHRPRAYRNLAEALSRLGRHSEALVAARKAMQLTEEADLQHRSIAVAVLSAQRKSAIDAQARATLARELAAERDRAASRELTRRLSIGLAVAGVLVSALFSYLLLLSRRHSRDLRQQEAILRETSMNAPDTLVLLDAKGVVRFANRSLFGVGATPSVHQRLADAVPEETRRQIVAAVDDLVEKRRAVSLDIRMRGRDGLRYFELRGNPIIDGDRLLGATLRVGDVTEIRTLEREVLAVASEERERLSSDLHEGVGQELTGVSLLLRSAATDIERGNRDILGILNESIAQVDRTINATRDLARGLSPVQVDRGSLSTALERLALDASRRLRIPVTSASQPADVRPSDDVSSHLYRIAYEAVTNAARHSGCTRVWIELLQDATGIRLSIADDGAGMSAAVIPVESLGTHTMEYRARLLNGTLHFESSDGAGTRVVVFIPRIASPAAELNA